MIQKESITGEYKHPRKYPTLPKGYDWETQKRRYCPPKVNGEPPPYRHELVDPYGKVYCHRGLYQRSTGITENSQSAIENGLREGIFLHEIDAFALNGLGEAIVAHDQDASGVTEMEMLWKDGTFAEILRTPLVGRRGHMQGPYLRKGDYVLGLIDILWGELNRPTGRTLQIDLRGEDLAEAISFYLAHTGKQATQYWPNRGQDRTLVYRLFEHTILKGYNHSFKSFDDLKKAIEKNLDAYETQGKRPRRNPAPRAEFALEDLHGLPRLIMVFSHGPLRSLAEETEPIDKGSRTSYEHFLFVVRQQVSSFVQVGKKRPYNFILEIAHSGLGLGYDRVTRKATNPLNGEGIIDTDVVTESCLDRAMIDVSLELRERDPTLLFASCTRLPDVITPDGKKFKAHYQTSKFEPWPEKEKEIPYKLRAIHGGLYPRSHIVIADDPLAEIAARTWIDEELKLDRSKLLTCSYGKWLEGAGEEAVNVIKQLNSDFLPNMADHPAEQTLVTSARHSNESSSLVTSPQETGDLDQGHVESDAAPTTFGYMPDEIRVARHSRIKLQISGEKQETSIPANAVYAVTTLAAYRAALVGAENVIRDIFSKDATNQRGNETIVNTPIGIYGTVLGAACERGNVTSVQLLLDAGADIHAKAEIYEAVAKAQGYPSYLKTPLEIASGAGRTEIVKTLLRLWGPNNKLSGILRRRYHSAFFDACEGGHADIVNLFLEGEADVNFVGFQEKTALKAACKRGNLGVAKRLLEKGANFNQPWSRSWLDPGIIQLLESYGAILPFETGTKGPAQTKPSLKFSRKKTTPPSGMPEMNFEPLEVLGPTIHGPYIRILRCRCLVCFLDKALYATILKTGQPNGTSSSTLWRLHSNSYDPHDYEPSGIIEHSIYKRLLSQSLAGEGSDS